MPSETMGRRWATVRVIEIRTYGDGSMCARPRRFFQNLASGELTADCPVLRPTCSASTARRAQGPLKTRSMSLPILRVFRVGLLYFLWKGGSDGGDVSVGCARSVNSAGRYQ
jgi:hypothetical protein